MTERQRDREQVGTKLSNEINTERKKKKKVYKKKSRAMSGNKTQ